MNSRLIIADAWHFTRENKNLMWAYSFLPAMLNTIVGIFYIVYQFFAFKRSPLFDNAPKSFLSEVIETAFDFFDKNSGLLIPTIIIAAIILILYLLLPTLCQGGLIQVIARMRNGEKIKTVEGITFGLLVFLPLLEYHLLIKGFSLLTIFTEAGFAVRNLGTNAFYALLPVFILAAIIGFIITLLFTYSEFFIVLKKKSVITSMGRSAKLVILSWQHTFLIAILMLIIGVRVIINIIVVLLIPALLFFTAGFLATVMLAKIGIAIGVVLSFAALFAASYFTGILNLFANAVWTYTFLELMNEKRTQEFLPD